ncbi:MAG: YggT family protein [Actinobacteria bacterium]|nr:MAG: YggT family protein [Actinomycetota bacterium]
MLEAFTGCGVLYFILSIFFSFLIAAVILSWVVALTRPPEWLYPIIRAVNAVTEPVLRPFRRLIPPIRIGAGALDVSILLVFLIVALLRGAVARC